MVASLNSLSKQTITYKACDADKTKTQLRVQGKDSFSYKVEHQNNKCTLCRNHIYYKLSQMHRLELRVGEGTLCCGTLQIHLTLLIIQCMVHQQVSDQQVFQLHFVVARTDTPGHYRSAWSVHQRHPLQLESFLQYNR